MTQLALFDYHAVDSSVRTAIIEQTDEIKALVKRTADDIVTIGERLLALSMASNCGDIWTG